MQNLTWYHKTTGDTLRFRDGEYGDIVEVEVRYEMGGTSMSNTPIQRGIKVSITPRHVEKTENPKVNVETSWLLGDARRSGRKVHVLTLKRRNDKALIMIGEMMDPHVATIAAKFREGDGGSAFDLISEIMTPPVHSASDRP